MTRFPVKSTTQEDILIVLAVEHRSIEQLIDALESVDDEVEAERRFLELYRVLSLHHYGELLVFYPTMREYEQTAAYLETAEEEHSSFKTLLEQMAHSSPVGSSFQAKLDELKEAIMGHIEEEENEIFPMVRICINGSQLRQLVQEYRTVQTKFAPKVEARICRNQKISKRKD